MSSIFTPYGATNSIAAGVGTASVALTVPTGVTGGHTCRVYNSGVGVAFVRFGTTGVAAALTDMPIPAGAVEVFENGPNVTTAAAILVSGTSTVYFTVGQGG